MMMIHDLLWGRNLSRRGTPAPSGVRRRRGLVAALAAVLALAGCVPGPGTPSGAGPSVSTLPPSGSSPSAQPSISVSLPSTSVSPTASTAAPATARSQLAGFLAQARAIDAAERAAAKLINAGVTATTFRLSAKAYHAVEAISLDAAADALPAGLPETLKRQAILVYSDLVSRRSALNHLRELPLDTPLSRTRDDVVDVFDCFGHGSPAAARFAADLHALVVLADATPRFTRAAPNSRAAAELLLWIEYVDKNNNGCDSCGGYVATALPAIVWTPSGPGSQYQGTIGGIEFTAVYHSKTGWAVEIIAC